MNLVKKLMSILSREMAFRTTRTMTRTLLPTLTHSLAPSIALSLMHGPKTDYYCFQCDKNKQYCPLCEAARRKDMANEYYANYYAGYYSQYYTERYVVIGDAIVRPDFDPSPSTLEEPKPNKKKKKDKKGK